MDNFNLNQQNSPQGLYQAPNVVQVPVYKESIEEKQARASVFSGMGIPTLIFAVIYTFCMYQNSHSIWFPVCVVATVLYGFYVEAHLKRNKQQTLRLAPFSVFCAAGMFLLSVATACTGSVPLIFINSSGCFILLICMILSQHYDMKSWTLAKGLAAIMTAFGGAVGSIADPFKDFSTFRKFRNKKRNNKVWYVVLGIAIAIPILMIVVVLLYYADAVFANMLRSVVCFEPDMGTVFGISATFCFAWFAAYCGIRYIGKERISAESKDYRNFEPVIANTVLTLILIVYVTFSAIQILYLFCGNMNLPDGYTYSKYAREGFFQLLFVCMINVCLVLFFMGCFKENRLKQLLLTGISICTYIMLASSAMRMCLYIQNYRLTFLRVFVLWMMAVIAILLAGILVQIYKERFPLFRYTVVVITISVLGLSFLHPDYWIARYNIANNDYSYLQYLSADAAPALQECRIDSADYWFNVKDDIRKMTPRTYNISYARAKKILEKQ